MHFAIMGPNGFRKKYFIKYFIRITLKKMNGKIIRSGGPELAIELEKKDTKVLIK